jgi:hypothetical protein
MKRPSAFSEVRAFIAEREIGAKLTLKGVSDQLGLTYAATSAAMSECYQNGWLAKEKRGSYVITVDSLKAATALTARTAPGPYNKKMTPGQRKAIKEEAERILAADFAGMIGMAKEQMFTLSLTMEKIERAIQNLDLSLFPEDVIWAELKRRRAASGREVK